MPHAKPRRREGWWRGNGGDFNSKWAVVPAVLRSSGFPARAPDGATLRARLETRGGEFSSTSTTIRRGGQESCCGVSGPGRLVASRRECAVRRHIRSAITWCFSGQISGWKARATFLSNEYFQPEHQTEEHPTHAKTQRMVVWAVGILMWCLALPAGGAEFVCQSSQIPPDTVYY